MSVLRSLGFWIGITLSGICLYLAVAFVNTSEMAVVSRRIDWTMASICGVMTLASIFARIVRWRWMLPGSVRMSVAISATGIGFLFTNILPMRLGDAARLVVVARTERISGWQSGASILIERFFDVTICLVIVLVILPMVTLPRQIQEPLLWTAAVALGVAGFIWLLGRWVRRGGRLPTIVRKPVDEFVSAMRLIKRENSFGRIIWWTVAIWIFALARQWSGLAAFVPEATLLEAALLTSVLNLSMAFPSAPANIGVFHYAGQLALVLPFAGKYSPEAGLGVATLLHLHFFVITMLVGVIGLWLLRKVAGERWKLRALWASVATGARSAIGGVRQGDDKQER